MFAAAIENGMDTEGIIAMVKDLPQQTGINLVKVKGTSRGTRGGACWAAPWAWPRPVGECVRST